MWAVLDKDNETVIAAMPPDTPKEEVERISKEHTIILMTLDNSPAYIKGKYKNGKFYPPEGYKGIDILYE